MDSTNPPADSGDRDPGDLGRRIMMRRRALGLSREEVAGKIGMHPTYLGYLEERADANPSGSTVTRLAVALETSVADLQGAGQQRPPGSGHVPDAPPILGTMDRPACLERLRAGGIGRVVFDDPSGPVALPVNFRMLGDDAVFRTGEGSIVAALRRVGRLTLEIDHLDEALGEGWSVLLSGPATLVDEPGDLDRVEELDIETWSGGDRPLVVRIASGELSGRQIRRHG